MMPRDRTANGMDAPRLSGRMEKVAAARVRFRSACAAVFAAALAGALPSVVAVVSYCREPTPHSMSSAQGETLCLLEGEYSYRPMADKSVDGGELYTDLGSSNENRRYSPLSMAADMIAKYVNYSDYALLVQIDGVVSDVWKYHCCQVCTIDCAASRYVCPLKNVDKNDNCSVNEDNQVKRCHFAEELVEVTARLLCAVKVSDAHRIPMSWWNPHGMHLATSWRNCPYRELAVNRSYLLMASAGTPLYGGESGLTGADIVVSVDNKRSSRLPESYFRRTNLEKLGYRYLIENGTIGKYCPLIKDIRRLSAVSSSRPMLSSGFTVLSAAVVATAVVEMLFGNRRSCSLCTNAIGA